MLTPSSLFKVVLIVHYLAGKENPKIALYCISIKLIAKTLGGKSLFGRFYSFSILNDCVANGFLYILSSHCFHIHNIDKVKYTILAMTPMVVLPTIST